jgi:CubicO group peptidase (beta-lactamase class C family)
MTIASKRRKVIARVGIMLALAMPAVLSGAGLPDVSRAQEASKSGASMEARVTALIPDLEAYIRSGMKAFDAPGLAIGIVTGDRLVYAKGFGVRSKAGGAPVDSRTVFQIGSTTKGFLAATMAIMVDRGKLKWDDRVVDLYPAFQLKDAWVTREFRAFDIIAQRSGLPPYAGDLVEMLGYEEAAAIRSLRHVEPVSSFRTTFAYTNMTHLLAGRIVSNLAGAPDWNAVARRELLDPLGMAETSFTAEAIEAAANHASGHRWTPAGTIEVPIEPIFPYGFGAAGDVNSTIEDMARWIRLQLGHGSFEGRRIVSPESLAYTRIPKVAIDERMSYAMGWIVGQTPNGSIVFHNGDTLSFGAFVGRCPAGMSGSSYSPTRRTWVCRMRSGCGRSIGWWTILWSTTSRTRSSWQSPDSRPTKNCPPSQRIRGRSRRLRRWPAASAARFSARPRCGRRATCSSSSCRRPEPRSRSRPGTAMSSGSGCCRAGGSLMVATSTGPRLSGFAQFEIGQDGKLGVLRLALDDGQTYEFRRE